MSKSKGNTKSNSKNFLISKTRRFSAASKASRITTRHQREPGVWLASTVLSRKTWAAEARDQVAAGAGQPEQGSASCGRARESCLTNAVRLQPGTIHIELRQAQVRIEGRAG